MGGSGGGGDVMSVEGAYGKLRRDLDSGGYLEPLPLDAFPLVQHLFRDLRKTTQSLTSTLQHYGHYKQISEELEEGVTPFKEENVRLIRENSHLRMEVVCLKENCDEQIRGSETRLKELEAERTDLRLLINRFVDRVKKLEIDSLLKTNKIAQLQERNLDAVLFIPELSSNSACRQQMEMDAFAPPPCPCCIRSRNKAEFGKYRDPEAADYLRISDSRIEALQMQIRCLKLTEKDMTTLLCSMKAKVEDRDTEIDKLRRSVSIRPGKDNLANGKTSKIDGDSGDVDLQLRCAEMQLEMLQRRNICLERKLKSSILQEHQDFMLGRPTTAAEREVLRQLVDCDMNDNDNYPTHDEMTEQERLKCLELQLSKCCKEKARLKADSKTSVSAAAREAPSKPGAPTAPKQGKEDIADKTGGPSAVSGTGFSISGEPSHHGFHLDSRHRLRHMGGKTPVSKTNEGVSDKTGALTSVDKTGASDSVNGTGTMDGEPSHHGFHLDSNYRLRNVGGKKGVSKANKNLANNSDGHTENDDNSEAEYSYGEDVNEEAMMATEKSKHGFPLSSSYRLRKLTNPDPPTTTVRSVTVKEGSKTGKTSSNSKLTQPQNKSSFKSTAGLTDKRGDSKAQNANRYKLLGKDDTSDAEYVYGDDVNAEAMKITEKSKHGFPLSSTYRLRKLTNPDAPVAESKPTALKEGSKTSKTSTNTKPTVARSHSQGKSSSKSKTEIIDNRSDIQAENRSNLMGKDGGSGNVKLIQKQTKSSSKSKTGLIEAHRKTPSAIDASKPRTSGTLNKSGSKPDSIAMLSQQKSSFGSKSKNEFTEDPIDSDVEPSSRSVVSDEGGTNTKFSGNHKLTKSHSNSKSDTGGSIESLTDEFDLEGPATDTAMHKGRNKPPSNTGISQPQANKSRSKSKSDILGNTEAANRPGGSVPDGGKLPSNSKLSQPQSKMSSKYKSKTGFTGASTEVERPNARSTSLEDTDNTQHSNPITLQPQSKLGSKSRAAVSDEVPVDSDVEIERPTAIKSTGSKKTDGKLSSDPKLSQPTSKSVSKSKTRFIDAPVDTDGSDVEGPTAIKSTGLDKTDGKPSSNPKLSQPTSKSGSKSKTRFIDAPVTPVDTDVSDGEGPTVIKSTGLKKADGKLSSNPKLSQSASRSKSKSRFIDAPVDTDVSDVEGPTPIKSTGLSKADGNPSSNSKLSQPPSKSGSKSTVGAAGNVAGPSSNNGQGQNHQDGEVPKSDMKSPHYNVFNLEIKLDKLQSDLGNSEIVKNKLAAENQFQKSQIQLLEEQLEKRGLGPSIQGPKSWQEAAKQQEMSREIAHLKSVVNNLDRDKDEMRYELDKKDEKLARMSHDCENHQAELSKLRLSLRNAELQIGHSGASSKEQDREVLLLRHQLESLRGDVQHLSKERDEAIQDCRRLAGAISKEEIERKSISSELQITAKEADHLRKQLQKYIEEVGRMEELLLQKEEEMDTMMEHYRNLSMEKSTLESHRTSLERTASSIQVDVRDAVDQNLTLTNQLHSQNALVKSYEEEIGRLTIEVSTLENKLSTSSQKERSSEADLKAARDLVFNMETKMDKLKLELANAEARRHLLEAETEEQKTHIRLLEEQLEQELAAQKRLEELLTNVREKEFEVERSSQSLAAQKDQLTERLMSLQTRTETLNEEVAKFRLKSIELQTELDRSKRQLQAEKSERQTAIAELRRVQEQLSTTSTNALLNSALGSPVSGGQPSSSRMPFSPMSDLDSPLGASTSRDLEGGSTASDPRTPRSRNEK